MGTTRFALNSECLEEEESKEDKHQIWLSFRSTDRGVKCSNCATNTHGIYPPNEMEKIAKKFVDYIMKGEEKPLAEMDRGKLTITPMRTNSEILHKADTPSPKVTKIMSTLETSLKSKFNRKNPLMPELQKEEDQDFF